MRRTILDILLVITMFVIHATLFNMLSIGNIIPNIMIILTALCGFIQGEKEGMFVGFFCGLLIDIFSLNILGMNALIYMFIGYFNGKSANTFFLDDIKMPLVFVAASDFVYSILYYLITFLLRGHFNFEFYFLNIILPEMAYTILLSFAIYPLIIVLDKFALNVGVKQTEEAVVKGNV